MHALSVCSFAVFQFKYWYFTLAHNCQTNVLDQFAVFHLKCWYLKSEHNRLIHALTSLQRSSSEFGIWNYRTKLSDACSHQFEVLQFKYWYLKLELSDACSSIFHLRFWYCDIAVRYMIWSICGVSVYIIYR